jgi:hypothetical protein
MNCGGGGVCSQGDRWLISEGAETTSFKISHTLHRETVINSPAAKSSPFHVSPQWTTDPSSACVSLSRLPVPLKQSTPSRRTRPARGEWRAMSGGHPPSATCVMVKRKAGVGRRLQMAPGSVDAPPFQHASPPFCHIACLGLSWKMLDHL